MTANEVIVAALRRQIDSLRSNLMERHVHQCPTCRLPWVHVPAPEIGKCVYVGAPKCGTCAEEKIGRDAA